MSRNTDNEIWKAIPGFARYEASDAGRIRNKATGRILTGSPATRRKCLVVCVLDDTGKERTRYVHRLVALAHLGSLEGKVVHHVNGCSQDPRLANLEVVTQAENMRAAHVDGTAHTLAGELAPELWGLNAHLTPVQVQTIRRARATGKRGAIARLAAEYNVSLSVVYGASSGQCYRYIGDTALDTEITRQEAIALRDARKVVAKLNRVKAAREAQHPSAGKSSK